MSVTTKNKEITMFNECWSCKHKRSVPGNAHIRCVAPDPNMVGDPHGIKNGWFIYPFLFDPVWKERFCANYSPINKPKTEKYKREEPEVSEETVVADKEPKRAVVIRNNFGGGFPKRVIINYHTIKSDHIFATPEYTHSEVVNASSPADLINYVEKQTDQYGHNFKYEEEKSFGFDFISHAGGVKIEDYNDPDVKKI